MLVVAILHFSIVTGAVTAYKTAGMNEDIQTPPRYEAEQMFSRRTRGVGGVRYRSLAQSIGMLIELLMLSAVLKVGIALLCPNLVERVSSVAASMKAIVFAHRTVR